MLRQLPVIDVNTSTCVEVSLVVFTLITAVTSALTMVITAAPAAVITAGVSVGHQARLCSSVARKRCCG